MNGTNPYQTEEGILGPAWAGARSQLPSNVDRRLVTLERGSARLVQRAADVGVNIGYLGVSILFDGHRAYAGPQTDWVIALATDSDDSIVPGSEQEKLRRLNRAGIHFPLIYVAHEIPKGRLGLPASAAGVKGPQPTTIDRASARQAIGPVPPATDAAALAERVGRSSQHLLTALGKALPIAGSVVAAPFLLAAAAVGALAAGLDPIVFGVIPAGRPVPGQPAAWYVLARWEWPSSPGSDPAATSTRPAG